MPKADDSGRSSSKRGWTLEAGLALLVGLPAYFGLPSFAAFAAHLALAVCYLTLVRLVGRRSAIEMWVPLFMLSVLIALLVPLWEKAREKHGPARQTAVTGTAAGGIRRTALPFAAGRLSVAVGLGTRVSRITRMTSGD